LGIDNKHILTDRRTLLAIAAICIVAAMVCVAILWGGAYLDRLAHADEKQQTTKEAELTREAFEIHSLDLVNYVDAYLHSLRAVYGREQSLEQARHYLDRVPFDRRVIDDLSIIAADGRLLLWSGDRNPQPVDLSDREYFLRHRQASGDELYFSPVEMSQVSGQQVFRMSRRIVLDDGSFAGVVLASVDPHSISLFYQNLSIGGQSTSSLLSTQDRRLRARYPLPEGDDWSVHTDYPLWQALKQQPQGAFFAASAVDGVERNYVYKKLEPYPLVVLVGFSEQDVSDRIKPRQHRFDVSEKILLAAVFGISLLLIVITLNRQRLAAANHDLQSLYEQVRGLALFDTLTGLPNRNLLDDRLAQALLDAGRNQETCALMYVDLDDFKLVNDRIGHDAGDHVLAVTASRMAAAVRATDTVSRRGGDEFVVLLPHAGTLSEVIEIAERLVQWVSEPIIFNGQACHVSASIGIALYPDNGDQVDEIFKAADDAMYIAKREGKNKIVLAEPKPPVADSDEAE